MSRTELCFRSFHDRITLLEERQAGYAPSDEQVERVLRKILLDKCSPSTHQAKSAVPNGGRFFVEDPKEKAFPKPFPIDPASLVVEPDAVPSRAYARTMNMLEGRLLHYPQMDSDQSMSDDTKDSRAHITEDRRPGCSNSV